MYLSNLPSAGATETEELVGRVQDLEQLYICQLPSPAVNAVGVGDTLEVRVDIADEVDGEEWATSPVGSPQILYSRGAAQLIG